MEERKRIRLPVEIGDDHEFSIDEERLDESLKRRIDELAEEKVAKSRTSLRLVISGVLGLFIMGMIAVMAMRGALIFAFIMSMAVIFNAGGIVDWIEGKSNG